MVKAGDLFIAETFRPKDYELERKYLAVVVEPEPNNTSKWICDLCFSGTRFPVETSSIEEGKILLANMT